MQPLAVCSLYRNTVFIIEARSRRIGTSVATISSRNLITTLGAKAEAEELKLQIRIRSQ